MSGVSAPVSETAGHTPLAGAGRRRVMVVAGEASGDRIAAGLIREVRGREPEVHFEGVAGPAMEAAGCRALFPSDQLAVVGMTEVLRHFGDIRRVFKGLKARLKEAPPDLLVCVDAPDFNLRLAKVAHKLGIPVVYYVSPQVWAWRRGRVHKIGRIVDHMMVIFPFETEVYEQAGVPVTYVGNPLIERIPAVPEQAQARAALEVPGEAPVVALLPGSRRSEVLRMGPVLLRAAELLGERFPDAHFVLPVAGPAVGEVLDELLTEYQPPNFHRVTDSLSAAAAADCAAVTSGTATLETAVVGTPLVVLYKLSPVTFWLAQRLIKVPHIGMVNLVAGREVAPELIQDDAEPGRVSEELGRYLADPAARERARRDLAGVRATLGENPSARAAEVVLGHIRREG
ncbi:lipid-A-disaccharide synthase [Thiohalorhabdus denitrificans]|uniref:lipid-A-disaccharide synthase n=1 Tax=Thiohalorhabdus denitrificans TaxID=381306 RepID=UPI0009F1935A|nr:lipid-A-disaccharide synthase [Thiohalorhabdus denitrificans]